MKNIAVFVLFLNTIAFSCFGQDKNSAKWLFDNGYYYDAVLLVSVKKQMATDTENYYLGLSYYALNEPEAAISVLKNIKKKNQNVHFYLGILYYNTKQFKKAFKSFRNINDSLLIKDARTYLHLIYLSSSKHQKCLKTINISNIVDRAPDTLKDNAALNIGLFYYNKWMHDSAIKYFNSYLSYNEDDDLIIQKLAISKIRLKQYKEGIVNLKTQLRNGFREEVTLFFLGFAYAQVGDADSAQIFGDLFISKGYFSNDYCFLQAQIYNMKGEYDSAILILNRAKKMTRSDKVDYNLEISDSYCGRGKLDEALKAINYVCKREEYYSPAFYKRSVIHFKMGKHEKSCEDLKMALKLGYDGEILSELKALCNI